MGGHTYRRYIYDRLGIERTDRMMIAPLIGALINGSLAILMLVMYRVTGTPFTIFACGFCAGTAISLLLLYITDR